MNIGQAARRSGLSAKMLRYYESIGLLPKAQRSEGGYRQYGAAELETLAFIKRSRALGFSLEDIRQLLHLWQDRERSSADVKALAHRHIQALEERILALQSLRSTLSEWVEHCHGDQRPDCPILEQVATGA